MPVSTAAPVVAGARRTFAPAATLFVLAPLIGEVLFGALPLSQLPFGLLGLMGLYGGGALLVRETARRRGLSAWWVVVLGLAYGIFEEGTVCSRSSTSTIEGWTSWASLTGTGRA